MSRKKNKPVPIESLLAAVLDIGTWLASVLIGAGLVLSLFNERTPFPTGAQVVNTGIGLFVLLPILRVTLAFCHAGIARFLPAGTRPGQARKAN